MGRATKNLMDVPQATSFAAVGEFLRSRDLAPLPRDAAAPVLGQALVSLHGDAHRRRRSVESRLFAAEALRRYEDEVLEPSIRQAFAGLAGLVDECGRAPINLPAFVTDLILNISIAMIGIDRRDSKDRIEIFGFTEPLIAAHEVEWSAEDPKEVIDRALDNKSRLWSDYLEPAYRRRQAAIRDGTWSEPHDLLSVLAEHGGLPDDVVAQECALYLVASVLTTTATITDAVDLILDWCDANPSDRALVVDTSSDFAARCVDETLRLRPPIKPLLLRAAAVDTTVGAHQVVAGETVGANVGTAHRDPAVYPENPDQFDPWRTPAIPVRRSHYSFGDGAHVCIGRPLVVGSARAGTQGDAVRIIRALFAADVRKDHRLKRRLAPTARQRYLEYPVTVRLLP